MMAIDNSYVNVKINVHGSGVQTIKMQKGCVFENNGGKYVVDNDGKLKVFDKTSGAWKAANAIEMKNYQFQTFKAVANNTNEGGSGIVYSKADVKSAMNKFAQGGFMDDMDDFLPSGYKLEKPKKSSDDNYVQVDVTQGGNRQATLKFQIADMADLKNASAAYQADRTSGSQSSSSSSSAPSGGTKPAATTVSAADKALLPTYNGVFYFDINGSTYDYSNKNGVMRLPIPIGGYELSDAQQNKMFAEIAKLNGKAITPELVDKLVNILLNYNSSKVDLSFDGEGVTTESMFHSIARFGEYLSPATIDKLLAESNIMGIEDNVADVKKLYNRMSPAQKDKYYSILLSKQANTQFFPDMGGSYQASGQLLAKNIFEKPVSQKNFNRLKSLVATMNKKGNGIADTGSECKTLIKTLLSQGKITKAQANQLYEAAGIKNK
ncbi:hypothetical protein IJO12_01010 [bacterium]|nr:hypothetical protein [bacterium]